MAQPSSVDMVLPDIHLLCLYKSFSAAFNSAVEKYYPHISDSFQIETHFGPLHQLSSDLKFDAIVSPANSYGRLDGAFDDAISRALSPKDDYHWTTREAQKVLYEKWKGFAPPGTCTIIPMVCEDRKLPWGVKYILLCPTMRIPQPVKWDREVIYECIWSMLCSIDAHNKSTTDEDKKIKSILMTPLATGIGMVPYEQWAEQSVLAMRDFVKASQNPERWSNMSWGAIFKEVKDVRETWQGREDQHNEQNKESDE